MLMTSLNITDNMISVIPDKATALCSNYWEYYVYI